MTRSVDEIQAEMAELKAELKAAKRAAKELDDPAILTPEEVEDVFVQAQDRFRVRLDEILGAIREEILPLVKGRKVRQGGRSISTVDDVVIEPENDQITLELMSDEEVVGFLSAR